MPKVVLIHPPHLNATDDRLDPPMGLLYIAAHLEKNGISTAINDLSGRSLEIDRIIDRADFYGITAYISSLDITRQIIRQCRELNPKAIIVVGGAHPSACPEHFLEADYVVVGQGEQAMLNIVKNKETSRIVYGTEPTNPFVFPAYHKCKISSYHRKIDNKLSLPYITSRGCPFQCAFCGLAGMHKLGVGVRMASPQTVYEHVKRMKEEFGIDRINFQDDIFTFNPKRLKEILTLITPLDIRFRCMGRAGYDSEETYKMLSDAGCDQVAWGVESGSQIILDRMRKQVKVQDNYEVIQWSKKYGITSRAFFILGFPGETAETLKETREFIEDADPDQTFVSNFIPYPGTKVGSCPAKFGVTSISKDFSQYYQVSKDGTGGVTIDTEWLSKEEFRELEIDFRDWLKRRPMRGCLQDYEIKLKEEGNEGIRRNTYNDLGISQGVRQFAC